MKKEKSQLQKGKILNRPKGWEIKKLGEVCDKILAGGDKPKHISKFLTDKFSVPIYANGEKNKGLFGYTNIAKITKPSITISGRGTIGYSEIRKVPFVPIVRLITLLPNRDIVDINFLHYNIKNIDFSNSGSSIPQLTVPMVKAYQIPIPPLSEQKRIVKILDRAFEAIDKAKANAEQNLKNAKELFQSKLQAIFNNGKSKIKTGEWEEKKLGEVCEVIAGQSPEGKYYNDKGEGLPFYQGKKEFTEKYIGEPTKWTTKITKEAIANDILMSVRAPVGPINFATQKICIGRGLAAIRAGKLIENKFLFNFLLKHKNEIIGNTGAVFNSINKTQIEAIKIPIPPLSEQKRIVTQLDALQAETKKLELIYQQKIDNLEELKKSILQKAFEGEL